MAHNEDMNTTHSHQVEVSSKGFNRPTELKCSCGWTARGSYDKVVVAGYSHTRGAK
jgi:hypothetical protein